MFWFGQATKKNAKNPLIRILIIFSVLNFIISNSFAQTSWKGTSSTSWSNASNWTNGIPSSSTAVTIGDASFTGTFQPKISKTAKCKSLTIGAGTKTSTLTVNRSLTVSGTITIGSNGTITHSGYTISLTGNWVSTGTYNATGSSVTVIFAGASQSISGATTFRKLTINSGSTTTLSSNAAVSKAFSVSGIFDPSTYLLTLTGSSFSVNASATIMVKASSFSGNYSVNPSLNSASTVDYASSAINQTVAALSYGTLKISGGTVKTLAANTTPLSSSSTTGNITITAGTLDLSSFTLNRGTSVAGGSFSMSSSTTLKIGGTNTFPANYSTVNLASLCTVEYNGTNQTVSNQSYGNLTFSSGSGAATKTMPATALVVANDFTSAIGSGTSVSFTASGAITVKGNTTIGASTTFNGGSGSHTLAGNFTVNGTFTGGTSTITTSGAGMVIAGSGTLNFNNLTVTGLGITASATAISVSGNLSTSGPGTFTHNTGGALTMTGSSKTISGLDITFYDFTITGSVTTTSSFTITSNLAVSGSFSATAGTVQMTGAGKTISGAGSITFYALRVSGTVSTAISFSMRSDLSGIGKLTATAGTLSFISTSSFAGGHDLFNVTINGTKLQLGTNAIMGVAGTFSILAGTFDVTTSVPNTVNYNGSGLQSVTSTTYSNLTMSVGGTKTAIGGFTVNNDLTIGTGTTFSASLFTHIVSNNWINNGTFTAGSSTIQLTGTLNSAVTGATTFNILTINKSSSVNFVTLNNNISVATLNMTTGQLFTGSNSVTITTTRSGNGIIMGTIVHTHLFLTGTAYAFEGPYNTVTFNSITLGAVTSVSVNVTAASVATFPLEGSINREYTISVTNTGTYSATLRLHYEDLELNGNTESTMALWRYTSSWTGMGKSANDATNNWVEQSSLTDISNGWTISDANVTAIWKGTTSSNWATAGNWKSGTVPSTGDIVQIGTEAFTNQPSVSSAVTAKAITFGSIQPATLTIATGGSLIVNGNVRGDWQADATNTINVGAQTMTVIGDMILSNGNNARYINLSISSGSLTVNGSLNQAGGASVSFTGTGSLNIGSDFSYTAGTFIAGTGTVSYNGTSSQAVAGGIAYNNLTINKSSGAATISSSAVLNGNLTLSAGTFNMNATMTVAGDVTINSGATLNENVSTFSLGGNWTRNGTFNSALGNITFNGSGSQTISTTTFNDLIINKSAGTVSPSGNLTINGDLTITSGTFDLISYTANRSVTGGTVTMGSGAMMKIGGASNFPSNFNIKTFSATSTVEYNGTVAQSVAAITYGNLVLSNGGALTKVLTGTTGVSGDITISSGTTLDGSSYTINLQGNWNNYGTFTPSTGAVAFNGGTSGANKLITGTTTLYNSVFTGYYSTAAGTDLTFLSTFNLTGYLNTGTNTRTYYGDAIVTGTTSEDGVTNIMGQQVQTIRLIGTFVSPAFTSTVKFKGTVAPIIDGTATPVTLINVEVANTSATGIVGYQDIIVYGTFNVLSGCLWNATSTNATFKGSFTNNGTVTGSGKFTFVPSAPLGNAVTTTIYLGSGTNFQNTGTVEFSGANQLIINGAPSSFNNVIISNTNASGITASGNWSVNGDFTVNTGSTFNAGVGFSHTTQGDITVAGTFNGSTSSVVMSPLDSAFISGSGSITFNDLTIASKVNCDTDFNVSGNFTNNGTFDASGVDIYFSGTSSATIGGSVSPTTLETIIINKSLPTSSVTLAINISGLVSVEVNGGILNLAGYSVAEETTNGGALSVGADATLKTGSNIALPVFSNGYTFDPASTVEYNGTTQAVSQQSYGHLTLSNSGTKTFQSGTTNIAGNLVVSGTASGTAVTNSSLLYFNGTSVQTVSALAFYDVTIDNVSGISLAGNVSVNNLLTFISGKLVTNTFKVLLGSLATISGEASGKYIVGTVQSTQTVGTGSSSFGGMGVSLASGPENLGNVTVVRSSGPGTAGVLGSHQGINRTWTITITGTQPASGRQVTFGWVSDDDNGKDLTHMQLYSRETSSDPWSVKTASTNVSVRSFSYTTTHFSDWTASDTNNSLPITLLSFTGLRMSDTEVDLDWATASEIDNEGFDVEKSINGKDFIKIGFVQGKGNSTARQAYVFADNSAYGSSYYRLRQIDLDGQSKYSSVILITGNKNAILAIYPNPVKDKVSIVGDENLMNENEVSLRITSDGGQNLIDEKGAFDQVVIRLNQHLDKLTTGIYYLTISTPNQNYIQRMIKL